MTGAQDVYDALVAEQLRRPAVALGRSLRRETLTVHGKMFAFLADDELVLKLPAARAAELVSAGAAEVFRSGGRPMKEWVVVPFGDDGNRWRQLMLDASDYVIALAARS